MSTVHQKNRRGNKESINSTSFEFNSNDLNKIEALESPTMLRILVELGRMIKELLAKFEARN